MFKRRYVRVDDHVTHTTKRGNLKNEMPFNMDKYIFIWDLVYKQNLFTIP